MPAAQAREKSIADQFEARRAKAKATRDRKIGRREERFAQVCRNLYCFCFGCLRVWVVPLTGFPYSGRCGAGEEVSGWSSMDHMTSWKPILSYR